MKKAVSLLLVLVMAFALCGCGVSEESSPAEDAVTEEQDAVVYDEDSGEDPSEEEIQIEVEEDTSEDTETVSQTVYRTETGECYHRDGCQHLKSKIETTVDSAEAMGLRPCSRCRP